jgi:lysophospholipase L1-like esterase
MRTRCRPWLLAGLAFLAAAPTVSAQSFFLKKGDVVVVMGDSITEQRLYSNYLELWSQTRFPSYNLVFRNVGIGGDRSTGGNARFKRDVLTHKPTVLTVDFGMNDGNYNLGDFNEKAYGVYMKGLQGIADQAKAANIRVAWITPQPVEHNPGSPQEAYNKTLEKFSAGVKEIAEKNGGATGVTSVFADQFHPYWAVIQKAREGGEKGRITGGDAVHPGPAGQALMAASILKGLHFPREVSSVSIDADGKTDSKRATVTAVEVKDGGVRFQREDKALPFFPESAKGILKHAPLLEEMNHYGLQVKGLKAGKYAVKLGGTKVAEYTAEELAAGVNLAGPALAAGPVADQVKAVVKAVDAKTNYYHGQIYAPLVLQRNIAKNPDLKDVPKDQIAKRRQELIDERMQKMPEYDAAIRRALEIKPHLVEVTPVQ